MFALLPCQAQIIHRRFFCLDGFGIEAHVVHVFSQETLSKPPNLDKGCSLALCTVCSVSILYAILPIHKEISLSLQCVPQSAKCSTECKVFHRVQSVASIVVF